MDTNIAEKQAYVSREEKNGITKEFLHTIFDYRDGCLYWKEQRSNIKIGNKVGCLSNLLKGARYVVGINGKIYYLSRLIFMWHHGHCPEMVDHENHDKLDDRIENLRAATSKQNAQNTSSYKNSSSQYLGVCFKQNKGYYRFSVKYNEVRFYKQSDTWEANIGIDYKLKFLGNFKTEEGAALAYNKAAVKYFGEFANLNIIKP